MTFRDRYHRERGGGDCVVNSWRVCLIVYSRASMPVDGSEDQGSPFWSSPASAALTQAGPEEDGASSDSLLPGTSREVEPAETCPDNTGPGEGGNGKGAQTSLGYTG